jgi:hypothetical protein
MGHPSLFVPNEFVISLVGRTRPPEPLKCPSKRPLFGNERTNTEIQVKKHKVNGDSCQRDQVSLDSPLTTDETEASMVPALEGFENYIISLATGKLDGYLDSFRVKTRLQSPA